MGMRETTGSVFRFSGCSKGCPTDITEADRDDFEIDTDPKCVVLLSHGNSNDHNVMECGLKTYNIYKIYKK